MMITDIHQRSKKSGLKDQRCKLRHESGPSFFVLFCKMKTPLYNCITPIHGVPLFNVIHKGFELSPIALWRRTFITGKCFMEDIVYLGVKNLLPKVVWYRFLPDLYIHLYFT